MHASSFHGFKDLFRRILARLAFACMSLKATKCFLLHQRLEVLGFFVTPDGIIMQPDAIERIERRDVDGNPTAPRNAKEIRTFLGAVQFYRRFVPRIALLAAPMNELLKKADVNDPRFRPGTAEHRKAWAEVAQSFSAILLFLRSSAVVSAPDLSDPLAEYVIVCDACDIACGGALLQWQYPGSRGPGPPAGTPLRGGSGPDPLVQSWRLPAGWKLRTIGYFHKTFNPAQVNYSTFDQEGAAILVCCRRWAKIITGRPTTLYTDSAVAATMLTKHSGTPRLARWGIELGTFMPFLKIQHRKGSQNGLADFISRYPTFERYVKRQRDELQLPDGVFDTLTSVPLFTHEIAGEDEAATLRGWNVELLETSNPGAAEEFWHKHENINLMESTLASCSDAHAFADQLMALRESVSQEHFWQEQREFNDYAHEWDIYSDVFQQTHGRKPVLWDLCCGEGGYSRGAAMSGFACYGFDREEACKHRYEHDPSVSGVSVANGMVFNCADVLTDDFWEQLCLGAAGKFGALPRPDAIHISPPCSPYSRLTKMNGGGAAAGGEDGKWVVDYALRKLHTYERHLAAQHGRPLLWQLENVVESKQHVTQPVATELLLCGTMMGHQAFRHRVFYCNYAALAPRTCDHEGKYVGSRGVRFSEGHNHQRFAHLPEANMYGVYSRPYAARGTADEWHGALGFCPATFSQYGLKGALPTGYARLLSGQMLAHSLNRRFGCPVLPPYEREAHEQDALAAWACSGYKPLADVHYLGLTEPGGYDQLTAAWPESDGLNELIAAMECDQRVLTLNELIAAVDSHLPDKEQMQPTIDRSTRHASRVDELLPSPMADLVESEAPAVATPELPATPHYGDELLDEAEIHSPYIITRADQLRDPMIARLIVVLEESASKNAGALWEMADGCLHHRTWDSSGDLTRQVYVPHHCRAALMKRAHYTNHRGHRPLFEELSKSFYWPSMFADCCTFTSACAVCEALAARPLNKVASNPIPTPARPFTVLHVDHADFRGRPSGPLRYLHILVATCALTRFTLFIPVNSTTAEETLKALNAKVFCIFGPPLVLVSDNGPAFISNLAKTCGRFWGYRHMHILPYNSQANGIAESSVKRIKLLLDRHCQGHKNWHVQLPTLQLKLNADTHTGTGVSPYAALFGREPVGIEQLENPSLYPATTDGDGFLHELAGRLTHAHETLRVHSDALKKIHNDEQNARKHARAHSSRHGVVEAGTVDKPKFAWLIHGSKEQASYLAKHGHGLPWKHKYKVLDTRPHSVLLEVPTDGSVPRVNPWQLRRRVAPAAAHSHSPDADTPVITESGLLLPNQPDRDATMPPVGGDAYAGDETAYNIESVHHAERIGRHYKIWLKWEGSADLTWRWRHELVIETTNEELLKEIDAAVEFERERVKATRVDAYAEQEDEFDEGMPDSPQEETEEPLGRGAPRERKPPERYMLHVDTQPDDDIARGLSEYYSLGLRYLTAKLSFLVPMHCYV